MIRSLISTILLVGWPREMNRAANGHGAVGQDCLQIKMDSELDPEVEEGRIACGDLKLRRFALAMTSLNVRGGRKNCLYAVPLCADKV
jgi:hypothetical protein